MAGSERVANLISYTVSEDHERPDLEACLEISDRINGTKPECMEALNTMIKCLLKPNPKVVLNTVQLLETLCKNCNMRFLYEMNNKKLVDALLKNLDDRVRRSKAKTKTTKPVDKLKLQVEEKILYLVQLWADTFMMHQVEFKNIHELYRNLRKEGVKFPDRDPNEKFMINFQGQTSPIFLAMDENYIVPSNNQGGPAPDPRGLSPRPVSKEPEYKHETFASKVVNTLYNEDDEYDFSAYDGVQISKDEVKVLEESISILKEIEVNAVLPGEMKSEVANEILADLVHVHKRIQRLLQSEKFIGTDQISEAIRLNDMINTCLTNYKARYTFLKENYNKGIKSEPAINKPVADATKANKADEDGNEEDEEHDKADEKKSGFVSARKLAPPKGWKAPHKASADLIDLMDADPVQGSEPEGKEERKENVQQQKIETKPNLIDNLLDLDFDFTSPPVNNNAQVNGANNNNFAFGLVQQPQLNSFNNAGFMGGMPQQMNVNQAAFNQFATNPMFPQPQFHGNFNTVGTQNFMNNPNTFAQNTFSQQQFMTAPTQNVSSPTTFQANVPFGTHVQNQQVSSPTQQNVQSPTQPQTNVEQKPAAEADDDFFSDIANRNK